MTTELIDQRTEAVKKIVTDYLQIEKSFVTPPKVKLVLFSSNPFDDQSGTRDMAVTTAIQCYAPGVAQMKQRRDENSEKIAEGTLAAGHHTTRIHTYFTWQIIGATRSVVHDVFHANPYYNSEQQSQRYVEAKSGNYLVPNNLTPDQKAHYESSAVFANQAYFQLLKKLTPEVEKRMKATYPDAGWKVPETAERLNSKTHKICQEIARYVLPIGQLTTFFHTLSELQLLRLFRASQMPHCSNEARFIIGSMISEAANHDPTLWRELELPLLAGETQGISQTYLVERKKEFDLALGRKISVMVNTVGISSEALVSAARNVLGLSHLKISDQDVLKLLMDPAENSLLADVYEIGMMDPLTAALRQISVTFATKLSHTADSQRQRQRRTPGSTPPIEVLYDGNPDYLTPLVIRENTALQGQYDSVMTRIFDNVKKAVEIGIPKQDALLLLPNALTVRVVESGDLFDWLHRWKQRLCYLAQEEIFFISVEQVEQVGKVLPESVNMLLAPCGIRVQAKVSPRCPEKERWCGQQVFNWPIEEYKEHRLI